MSKSEPKHINPWTLWIPIVLVALAGVVTFNWLAYLEMKAREEQGGRPPFIHRAEGDLILRERDGSEVRLSQLRGKVILAAWVYTRCPRGCAGVIAKMKKFSEDYADRADLRFIAFAVDPDDTPEMLKSFADQLGVGDDKRWWFVNGDPERIRKFMERQLQFRGVQMLPEEDRLTPDDKFMHDLRVALIDHQGNVRRLADLVNADPEIAGYWDQQLREDMEYVLAEQEQQQINPSPSVNNVHQ